MEKSYKPSEIMSCPLYRLNSTEATQVPAGDPSQAAMLCPVPAQELVPSGPRGCAARGRSWGRIVAQLPAESSWEGLAFLGCFKWRNLQGCPQLHLSCLPQHPNCPCGIFTAFQ